MKIKKNSNLNDIIKNFNLLESNSQRFLKTITSSINGIKDPDDGTHISHLTDLSSMHTLKWLKLRMEETEEGLRILKEKPRVNEETLNFNKLKNYNKDTLGYQYYKYMSYNEFSPDLRPVSKYIPDLELAYICQRYKETHDFYHVLLNYGRTVQHEIAVKWFEALQFRLPSSSIAGIFGCLRLTYQENFVLYSLLLPNIIKNSEEAKFLMGIYFEERLEENIYDLRKELKITPLL